MCKSQERTVSWQQQSPLGMFLNSILHTHHRFMGLMGAVFPPIRMCKGKRADMTAQPYDGYGNDSCNNGGYGNQSNGTVGMSFAVPMVAGVAGVALMGAAASSIFHHEDRVGQMQQTDQVEQDIAGDNGGGEDFESADY
uniref:Uncharacterized protein n=1 Tax=Trieres chinensis TaxID=1514140 RepID=A0A7S2EPQ8_TRICV|mmetsp:Transcript_31840/g.65038  ORF Transcript_31840/g.65038 Transcript_31840/m.65038 type:complete len:139 (+) Transcript_31840:153-569(+)